MEAICEGCSVNHRELVVLLEDPKECLSFLLKHSLLKHTHNCPNCGSALTLNVQNCNYKCGKITVIQGNDDQKKKKSQCHFLRSGFKGTFFENSQLTVKQVLDLVYFWLSPARTVENVAEEVKTTKKVTVNWFSFCREVTVHYCDINKERIGGVGAVVEIDEAKFGKKKYKRGDFKEGQWVLGGLERGTKKLFLVTVKNKREDTLVKAIKEWVYPGTKIISDCISSYKNVELEGYERKVVTNLHRPKNAFDPDSDDDLIDNVEKLNKDANDFVPAHGRKKRRFVGYLAESLFRKAFKTQEERFHNFLLAASAMYTPY